MTPTSSARCGFPAQEPAGKAGRDAWAAADDLVLRKIAQAGLSGLSGMINGTPAETPPPAPAPGRRGSAVASLDSRRSSRAGLQRPISPPNTRIYLPFCAGKTGVTGCQPCHLPDISSRIETRRVTGIRDAERRIQQGAGRSVDVGQERLDQAGRRQFQSCAGAGNRRRARPAAGQGQRPPVCRQRDFRRDPRERARLGRVHHSVDVISGQRPSDGIADHHRCAAPLVRAPHHGGDSLFRLRPAGPQGRLARADLGQAGGQPDHPGRRRPRHDTRPACRPDPGLLRHPDRQSLRLAA